MRTIDIHNAIIQLSALVDQAAKGKPFIIAKAGKPLVKVLALAAPDVERRLGFMTGEIEVPEDLVAMGAEAIAALFSEEK